MGRFQIRAVVASRHEVVVEPGEDEVVIVPSTAEKPELPKLTQPGAFVRDPSGAFHVPVAGNRLQLSDYRSLIDRAKDEGSPIEFHLEA
ncbi:MAG: hypothetical protein M3N56_12295 [Actinomycetota bacterium]|nr:hypothetical protein [Actinomycetota bacterium]